MSAVASVHKPEVSPLYLDQEAAASGKARPDSRGHQQHDFPFTSTTAYSPASTRISLPPIRSPDQRQRQAADGGQDKDKDNNDSNHLVHRSTHLVPSQRTTGTHADDRQTLPGIDRLTPQGPLEARPSSAGSAQAGQQAAPRVTSGLRPASSSSAFDLAMSAAAAPKTEHAHQLPPPPGYHDSQISHSSLALHSYSHAHNRHRAHSQTSTPDLGESLPPPWDPAKAGRPSTSTPSLTRPRSPSPLRRSNGPSGTNSDVNGGEGCKKRKYAGMASLSAAAAGGGPSDRTADASSPDIPTASHHHHHSFPGVSLLDQYTPTLEPSTTSTNFSFDTSQMSPYNQSIEELSTTAGGAGGAAGAASASQRSHSVHSPSPEGDEKGGNGRTLKQTKRAAQNRAAQQAFRKRKEERMKELEEKEKLLNSLVAREAEVEKRERALAAKLHAHATAGPVASSTGSVSAHAGSPPSAAIAGPSNTSHDWERAFTGFRGPAPSVAAAPSAPSNQQYQAMCEKYEVATREKMELRRALENTNMRLADREQLIDSLRRSLEDMASENRSLRAAADGALGRGR